MYTIYLNELLKNECRNYQVKIYTREQKNIINYTLQKKLPLIRWHIIIFPGGQLTISG